MLFWLDFLFISLLNGFFLSPMCTGGLEARRLPGSVSPVRKPNLSPRGKKVKLIYPTVMCQTIKSKEKRVS
jgi:hypothetical protein